MTPRRPKQTGTEGETWVTEYLRQTFPGAHRLAPAGNADIGDIDGLPGCTVQVKAGRGIHLAEWVDATAQQAERAGNALFVVVHRRVGRGQARIGDWYVTMPLRVFAPMYTAAAPLVPMPRVRS